MLRPRGRARIADDAPGVETPVDRAQTRSPGRWRSSASGV